jgi:bifunctional non-homologous end joining protein LigD
VAVPGRLPFIAPMLATPARHLPDDPARWAAEVKWDGARALAYVADGAVTIRNRNGSDVTAAFPEIAAALARAAGRRTLILDGEVTAFDGERPSFSRLQRRLHQARPAATLVASVPVTYVAFDLLRQARRDLLANPYEQRRALLDALALDRDSLVVPPAFPGQASAVTEASRQLGLEGVILKRLGSHYHPGRRTDAWLKVKHVITVSVLIGGWLPGNGWRAHLAGSILAGDPTPRGLEFLGQVGAGFTEAELAALTERLRELEQPESPFADPVPQAVARRAHWARPVLACEVSYSEITPSGRLRHPVWRGLRPA